MVLAQGIDGLQSPDQSKCSSTIRPLGATAALSRSSFNKKIERDSGELKSGLWLTAFA